MRSPTAGADHAAATEHHRPARRPGPPRIAAFVTALGLLLACSGCKYVKDEFTFLDRAAPPAPPPPVGTDAER